MVEIREPWLLVGDLNVVIGIDERQVGAIPRQVGCPLFRSFFSWIMNLLIWGYKGQGLHGIEVSYFKD